MSRQLDAAHEDRVSRRHEALVRALEFELDKVLSATGKKLLGFSMRIQEWDCLMTLRAEEAGEQRVAFVGAEDVVGAITKAVRVARAGKLKWKEDKWRANGG